MLKSEKPFNGQTTTDSLNTHTTKSSHGARHRTGHSGCLNEGVKCSSEYPQSIVFAL